VVSTSLTRPNPKTNFHLDPESRRFGEILQNVEIGEGVLPHHLYFNNNGHCLYTTALGGS